MADKITVDFSGTSFKQQYIYILSQQIPLAELEKLTIANITIKIKLTENGEFVELADTGAVQIIADIAAANEPEPELESESEPTT